LEHNADMSDRPQDPRWPKLLSLSVHEFRTPMTVVAGYIRMLLKDRAGPVTDQQRRLLEEAEKSCARLSALLAEMSDLGALESGTATVNRSPP
jgi:signal transduction histidine kinase